VCVCGVRVCVWCVCGVVYVRMIFVCAVWEQCHVTMDCLLTL